MRTRTVVLALVMAVGVLAQAGTAEVCPPPCPPPCPPVSAAPVCPPEPCPPMGAGPMLTDEQVIEMCMGCSMGLTQDQIAQFKSQGLSNGDIIIAHAVATKACVPVKDVIAAWLCDKNWNTVFSKYNVSLGDLKTCTLMSNPDVEAFNKAFLAQYYGICEADLNALREKGLPWGDVYLIANASVRTSQPVATIAALRSQGVSWSDIATRHQMCLADLIRPVQMRSASARAICGSGPMTCPVAMYGLCGNILLTYDMATNLYSRGHDWLDVAIAANVSKHSGVPIENSLDRIRQGALWDNLLVRYGVAPGLAYNVCDYPFPRTSIYSRSIQQMRWNKIEAFQGPSSSLTMGPGIGMPCGAPQAPCPAPCPTVCPTPAPCPPPCPPTGSGPECPPAEPVAP